MGGGGHSLGFVILGVGAHSALLSFLFALCIDISVEDGRDFSGDSALSLFFLVRYIYYMLIRLV